MAEATSRLSVSALAWSDTEEEEGFELLSSLGVCGVELLPPRIRNSSWGMEGYQARLARYDLRPVAFQAIYFGLQGASLLGPEEEFQRLLNHTVEIAALADALVVPLGVFGAPGLRKLPEMPGQDQPSQAQIEELGAERLARLDQALLGSEFRLCLEPLTRNMGCDYLNSCAEVVAVLDRIQATRLCTMLDTASTHDAGLQLHEEFARHAAQIRHIHLSEPGLGTFSAAQIDYQPLCRTLGAVEDRSLWASIEMLRQGASWRTDCKQAVATFRSGDMAL